MVICGSTFLDLAEALVRLLLVTGITFDCKNARIPAVASSHTAISQCGKRTEYIILPWSNVCIVKVERSSHAIARGTSHLSL